MRETKKTKDRDGDTETDKERGTKTLGRERDIEQHVSEQERWRKINRKKSEKIKEKEVEIVPALPWTTIL